ncbi:MAG: FAD-dependent monooxygenase [Paracoccaceae bacterium]
MVIIGAGPIGLGLAIDLAQQDVPVVVLDDNDKVRWNSRAVCYAKRPLEILERLGCGRRMVEKGVEWNLGKVFRPAPGLLQLSCPRTATASRPSSIWQQYIE